jgi:hypothetical protein
LRAALTWIFTHWPKRDCCLWLESLRKKNLHRRINKTSCLASVPDFRGISSLGQATLVCPHRLYLLKRSRRGHAGFLSPRWDGNDGSTGDAAVAASLLQPSQGYAFCCHPRAGGGPPTSWIPARTCPDTSRSIRCVVEPDHRINPRPEPRPAASFPLTEPLEEYAAQGSLSSLAAFPLRRGFDGAAWMFSETVFGAGPILKRIVLIAARQEPAPREEPQGRTAGPALQASYPSSFVP